MNRKTLTASPAPERWSCQAGDAALARLDIPPDARRERLFEISVAMIVRAHDAAVDPWHQLRIFADGDLQWSRRCPTAQPAEFDGLDYRFRRRVAVGRTLRLLAHSDCSGGRRLKIHIEVDEV